MNESNTNAETRAQGFRAYRRVIGLGVVALALAMMDRTYEKHSHIEFEKWFNFYGFFAILATVVLVLAAQVFRVVLGRQEDYEDG